MDQVRRPRTETVTSRHDYQYAEQVGHLLRRAYQRHVALFEAASIERNLTSVQFCILCALDAKGPQSQSELVVSTSVDQGTIRGIISRLSSRGLVSVKKDPSDSRKVIMALTKAGSDVLDRILPTAKKITEQTIANLNAAERMALLHTLQLIANQEEP
jgi:MarR family transcriptional regulator, lower aerobic nicotinate degradation pathway regulator